MSILENMRTFWFCFIQKIVCCAAFYISQQDVSKSVFPIAPGFTYSRETYVIGAYALLQKNVIRFTSLPPNQVLESIKSGSEARYARQARFDQWKGKQLYCLYGTEVTPNTSAPEEPLFLFWSVVPVSTIHAFAHL